MKTKKPTRPRRPRNETTSKRKTERRTSPRVATSAAILLALCDEGSFMWRRHDRGAQRFDVDRHIRAVAGSALTQKPGERKAKARAGRKRT